ncbi:AAA-like domain protein [Corynebacterium oculi]|uniref:AAA-like domain protein n=2 Tax=Corynebacterium oculi TaxID=1544416 RepID=A0A0Q0TYA6_9CORY|nr:AAA-like domain protein [Corynebacterium oculi]
MIGTPVGRHVTTSMDVGCDAFAWFREGIIANPSAFVLSLPGLGKSTMVRKMLLGHVAQGHVPIIAGDVKAEYVGFTQAVGGQVITLGHGVGSLNPLDVGALGRIIPLLEQAEKWDLVDKTKEQVHGRQVAMVRSLVGLARANNPGGHGVADYEAMVISMGLRELYASRDVDWANPPTLRDLIAQIDQGSQSLRTMLRARSDQEWHERTDALLLSLNSLLDGATGKIFSGQTTEPIDVSAPAVCIDVSALDSTDRSTKAAVVVACWSNAFGSIEAAHVLADAGLAEQRYFGIVLDEMWQTLAVGAGMVSEVDALTRLNRTTGTALYMITHTFKDLQALPTEEDRKTAMGFIERAGMVICGGLPLSELDTLSSMLPFTQAEAQMVTSWSKGAAPKRARTQGANATPPGRGRFMVKASKDGSPGIPIQTMLFPTEYEHRIHDTNMRFDAYFAQGQEVA